MSTACTISRGPGAIQPPEPSEGVEAEPDSAVEEGGFFWKGRGYGTDAYAGPFDLLLNKGMSVAQWNDLSRDLSEIEFQWRAVERSITNPSAPVERAGGWAEVFSQHVFPTSSEDVRRANWVPNYTGHLIEGGISYRRLAEWNEGVGVPLPKLSAAVVSYAAAILNEAYEMPSGPEYDTDDGTPGAVMDLLFFDPLGILLFSFDGPARFFAETLGATVWPTQAAITLDGFIVNNGQAAIFKFPVLGDDLRLFMRAGLGVEAGLTFKRPDGIDLSVGAGFQSTSRFVDPFDETEAINQAFSMGIWFDRDNVLLGGLTYDYGSDRRFAVNVFPGVVDFGFIGSPGFFAFVDGEGRPFFGISGSKTLGLGTGLGFF